MGNTSRFTRNSLLFTVVTLFTLFAAFPFYWMFLTAFKTNRDLIRSTNMMPLVFNDVPTLQNFDLLLNETNYKQFVFNSIFVGIVVVLITIIIAVPAAYSLARLTGKWGERLGIGIFMVYLIPPTLLFIPLARVVSTLRLQDSLWSLIVIYPTFTIPFCTWLLMGFIKTLPKEVEEQAMVDGCSRIGAMTRIVMPLALPGILTVIVFAFTLTMHEFIYALAFVSASSQKTISIGMTTELIRGDVYFWGPLMAGAIIVALPVGLLYNFFLDRFVAGFTLGAIKG
jgi:multiple sugar transport system permease protein